jgi:hypothetical protein
MPNAWRRLAAAVLSFSLLVALAQCNLKQQPGGKCTSNGRFICQDPASALLCQSGTLVALPCRGPKGCQGAGMASQCDDDLSQEGDACVQTLNENYSCSTDHKKELVCKDGKFVVISTCKGPKACVVNGTTIDCDDSFGDVGDLCQVGAGDANYACSTDKKSETVCKPMGGADMKAGKFEESSGCRGIKGCHVEGETVYCDQSFAREGDLCRPVDNHSCTEDAKAELKCSAQMRWAKQRECKHGGCKIKTNEVICD